MPSDQQKLLADDITSKLLNNFTEYNCIKTKISDVIAYFLKYAYIPIPSAKNKSEAYNIAISAFVSAPWISSSVCTYIAAFDFLKNNNFLLFEQMCDRQYSMVINKDFDCGEYDLNRIYIACIDDAYDEINRRKTYISVSDSVGDQELRKELDRVMEFNSNEKLTIKIMAYHGKTWVGSDSWISSVLSKYPCLKIKILIVGSRTTNRVREGAPKRMHNQSIKNGFKKLTTLYKLYGGRIDVRYYGNKNKYSYLRGAIIEDSSLNIRYCAAECWKMGDERGIYGKTLKIDKDANMAYIVNSYYDNVFKHSIRSRRIIRIFDGIKERWEIILLWFTASILSCTSIIVEKNEIGNNHFFLPFNIYVDLKTLLLCGCAVGIAVVGAFATKMLSDYIDIHQDR